MSKEISCRTHQSILTDFSLDGRRPLTQAPVFSSLAIEEGQKSFSFDPKKKGLLEKDIFITEIAEPPPQKFRLGDLNFELGSLRVTFWGSRDRREIHHFHLGLGPLLEDVGKATIRQVLRSSSRDDRELLKAALYDTTPNCDVSPDHLVFGIRRIESPLFLMNEDDWAVNPGLSVADSLSDAIGNALGLTRSEGHSFHEVSLDRPPFFFKLMLRNVAQIPARARGERPQTVSIHVGVDFAEKDYASMHQRIGKIIQSPKFGAEEIRQVINPFIRLVVEEEEAPDR